MSYTFMRGIISLIALLALGSVLASPAPRYQRPSGPLPDELQKAIETKQEIIKQALDHDPVNEWTGNYYSQDGLTAGTMLSWHPNAGFVIRWSTCSHGWRESANHGAATLNNGNLTLSPELTGSDGSVYQIGRTLVPVMWGQQRYFVWSDRLINFCYAVANSKNAPELDAFFLKDVDRDKHHHGLPNVPLEFRKYLSQKPIIGKISKIKPNAQPWIKEFTLDVGKAVGVVPKMKFYALTPRNVYMLVEVIDADEHSSRAYVVTSGFRRSDKKVTPKVGWKVTSRAPRDAATYYPG